MVNQERFLELMEEIRQIAAVQQNFITKEEIGNYLVNMDLSDGQLSSVYNYLSSVGVVVEGHHYVSGEKNLNQVSGAKRDTVIKHGITKQGMAKKNEKQGKTVSRGKNTEIDRAERNRRLYKRDLDNVEAVGDEELKSLVLDFLNGSERAREKFIENRLKLVVKLAGRYRKMDMVSEGIVPVEEIIAEGNMGLLIGVNAIAGDVASFISDEGKPDLDGIDEVLRIEIISAMETFIDSHMNNKDMENVLLARINLLHEAAKYMTEEMGRVPFKEELSEYTKISVEEISRIMGISEDAKRISNV